MELREQAKKLWAAGGKTLQQIADELAVPLPTVKSWKQRGLWGKDAKTQIDASKQKDASKTQGTARKSRASANKAAAEAIAKNDKLTDREKEFCACYVHAPNASQAAMLMGRYATYAAARTEAAKMMAKPAVQEEIKRLKALKLSMMMADGDDVVEMHMRIAFADMSAFVEWGQEEVDVIGPFGPIEITKEDGKKERLKQIINVVRFRDCEAVDGTVVSQVKIGRDGASIKLADRQKSLDFLERYFTLNPMDKHKKEYDAKRFALEERRVKVTEDKLHGVTKDIDAIKEGLKDLISIINAPVPDRRLDDE